MFEKLKRFTDKWASGGFDVEEPDKPLENPWRAFGILAAALFIVWLVWFGLSKYFYAQDAKELDIPNPIKAVPADSEFYAQKRKVRVDPWILTAEVRPRQLQHELVSRAPLWWTIQHQYPQKLYEKLFYKPKPFIDGGWFQRSIYSSPLEGLKYCRIGFKPDNYFGVVNKRRMQFTFLPEEGPCLQHEDYGGRGETPVLIFSKAKSIFYLDFTGYLLKHVNNYDDFNAYIYRCEITSDQTVACKLIGYDHDREIIKERLTKEGEERGSLVPLRLWN